MKKVLLFASALVCTTTFAQDCSKIFISEYVEGFGNNKALEIYNPTSAPVQLSEYFLQRYSNGATVASPQGSFQAKSIQLPSYSLQPYEAYIIVLDRHAGNSAPDDPAVWTELYTMADAQLCSDYDVNNVMNFNGNDALILAKGNASNLTSPTPILCDVFGKIGEDPENTSLSTNGWSSVAPYIMTSGNPMDRVVTENHSMIRKTTILKGVTTPIVPSFNPLAEYDSIPPSLPKLDEFGDTVFQADGVTPQWVGNWGSLGWHSCNCDPSASVQEVTVESATIYPNPSNGIFYVKGSEAISSVEVYNSLGQKIKNVDTKSKQIIAIDLDSKAGLYLVKLSDSNGKSVTKRVIVK